MAEHKTAAPIYVRFNPRLVRRKTLEAVAPETPTSTLADFSDHAIVVPDDVWIDVPIGTTWFAALRVIPARITREPVIGEIRIFPAEATRVEGTGTWSAEILGTGARAPRGGITTAVLRQVHLANRVTTLNNVLWHRQRALPANAGRQGLNEFKAPAPRPTKATAFRFGRRRDEVACTHVAHDYIRARADKAVNAAAAVAAKWGLSEAAVKMRVKRAEEYGLVARGRETGELVMTPKGELLRLQRIATEVETGGVKAPQLKHRSTKKARKS